MQALTSLLLLLFVSASWADVQKPGADQTLASLVYKNPTSLSNIVFVHGTPGSADAFSFYINDKELRAKANLMSVDRLGFGKSTEKAEVRLSHHSKAVLNSLDHHLNKPEKATCVGHSYGSTVCLDLAARYPDRFDKVILIAGAFNPHRRILRWYNYAASSWPVKWVLSRALINSNKEMYGLKKELLDLEGRLGQITASVLLIHGKKDRIVPYGDSTWLEGELKSKGVEVELKTYPKDGHFVLWKQEENIKKDILDFM